MKVHAVEVFKSWTPCGMMQLVGLLQALRGFHLCPKNRFSLSLFGGLSTKAHCFVKT